MINLPHNRAIYMKNISLELPNELADFLLGSRKAYLTQEVVKLLKKELAFEEAGGAEELVRVITRSKARVLNWEDLEREIVEGAIG